MLMNIIFIYVVSDIANAFAVNLGLYFFYLLINFFSKKKIKYKHYCF